MTPLISIIVPIYQVEPYLRKCLDSIVNQTYANLEIILVDDGSPDSCGAICDEYAAKDARIRVIHQENGGVSSARNAGLQIATGDYIGWVDPDDWIEPDYYESLLDGIIKHKAEISICGLRETPIVDQVWIPKRKCAVKELLINDRICASLVDKLYAAKLFDDVSFPTGRTFEDLCMMHRFFERAVGIVCIPYAGYHRVVRPGSIMQDKSIRNRYDWFLAARKRYDELLPKYGEYRDLLLRECMETYVRVFISLGRTTRKERDQHTEELLEMRSFFCENMTPAFFDRFGGSGQLVLRLARYDSLLFARVAYLTNWLYEERHGGFSIQ